MDENQIWLESLVATRITLFQIAFQSMNDLEKN
jgi:hypothetical protein